MSTLLRMLLPLLMAGSLLFAPVYTDRVEGKELGSGEIAYAGRDFLTPTLRCLPNFGEVVSKSRCRPVGGLLGLWLSLAIILAVIAGLAGMTSALSRVFANLFGKVLLAASSVSLLGFLGQAGLPASLANGPPWGVWMAFVTVLVFFGMRSVKQN